MLIPDTSTAHKSKVRLRTIPPPAYGVCTPKRVYIVGVRQAEQTLEKILR